MGGDFLLLNIYFCIKLPSQLQFRRQMPLKVFWLPWEYVKNCTITAHVTGKLKYFQIFFFQIWCSENKTPLFSAIKYFINVTVYWCTTSQSFQVPQNSISTQITSTNYLHENTWQLLQKLLRNASEKSDIIHTISLSRTYVSDSQTK